MLTDDNYSRDTHSPVDDADSGWSGPCGQRLCPVHFSSASTKMFPISVIIVDSRDSAHIVLYLLDTCASVSEILDSWRINGGVWCIQGLVPAQTGLPPWSAAPGHCALRSKHSIKKWNVMYHEYLATLYYWHAQIIQHKWENTHRTEQGAGDFIFAGSAFPFFQDSYSLNIKKSKISGSFRLLK